MYGVHAEIVEVTYKKYVTPFYIQDDGAGCDIVISALERLRHKKHLGFKDSLGTRKDLV